MHMEVVRALGSSETTEDGGEEAQSTQHAAEQGDAPAPASPAASPPAAEAAATSSPAASPAPAAAVAAQAEEFLRPSGVVAKSARAERLARLREDAYAHIYTYN